MRIVVEATVLHLLILMQTGAVHKFTGVTLLKARTGAGFQW